MMGMNMAGVTILTKIEEHLALITLPVVWSAIIVFAYTRMPPSMGMDAGQILIYVLTVLAGSIVLSAIPAIPVVYGWYTGKPVRSALIGALLFPALYISVYVATSPGSMVFIHVTETILYLSGLSLISGLAGYCAAQRTNRYLAVGITLVGVWFFVFTSGIN